MKQLIFLCATIMLLSMTCNDDEADMNDMTGDDCRLVKRTFDIPNDPAREEAVYSYDDQDRLTGITVTSYDRDPLPYITRTSISYNGNNLDELNTYSTFMSDPEERNFRYQFFYVNGELDSIKLDGYNAFENIDSYMLVEFNSGKLSQMQTYFYNPTMMSYELNGTTSYTWDQNNVVLSETVTPDGTMSSTSYIYDNMNKAIGTEALAYSMNVSLLSENNMTSVIRTTEFGSNTETYTYTYNSMGYPATSSQGSQYPLYEYDYECN